MLDPWVTAQFLGILAYTLNGEAVLKGRSLFADRLGDEVASPLVTLVDDPTDPEAFTATDTDGEGLATRRNELIEGGVLQLFVHNAYTRPPDGHGVHRLGGAGRLQVHARRRLHGHVAAARHGHARPSWSPRSATGCSCRTSPACTRASTRSAATSPPAPRACASAAASWPSRVREFTIASTLQKMLKDVRRSGNDLEWLPMSAAGVSLVIDDVTISGV